jgi:very-short-patch-repair endonuclease
VNKPRSREEGWDVLERQRRVLTAVSKSFDGVSTDERRGEWEEQQLQYIVQRICSTVSDASDHIYTAENKCKSPIESMMYLRLKDSQLGTVSNGVIPGMEIFTQHRVGRYIVDFLVRSDDVNIVIECDGHNFHEKTKQQVEHDKKRDRYMQTKGYKILRYSGSEIYRGNIDIHSDLMKILFPKEFEGDDE